MKEEWFRLHLKIKGIKMSKNSNWVDGLVAVATLVAGGLAVQNMFDADVQKARAEKAKARRDADLKRSQAIREQAKRTEGQVSFSDVMDLVGGRVPTDMSLRELLAMDDDSDRFNMYEAMKADGIEFSNVQMMKLKQSFTSRLYRMWV